MSKNTQWLCLWKAVEHQFGKRGDCKFSIPWPLSKSNELNEDVERGIYNKRSADDHTTLPPVINRLDSGSVLRMTYVNQPTEELRRQFLKDILRFSKCRDNVSKSSTIIFKWKKWIFPDGDRFDCVLNKQKTWFKLCL